VRNKLSLRARLLLAVGAITVVAFVLADFVVFGALRSYLYNQVDTALDVSHGPVLTMAEDPAAAVQGGRFFVPGGQAPGTPGWGGAPSGNKAGGSGTRTGPAQPMTDQDEGSAFCAIGRETAPGMFIEVRTASGSAVTGVAGSEECAAFQPGSASSAPLLPDKISGFATSRGGAGDPTTYFTTGPAESGGPTFRVRASQLPNGDVLVLATPISNITSTLSQLVVVELIVTVGALVAALGLGLWLVRLGLRPLRDIERTAEVISGGDLMHRVPNPNPRTEVGHLATAFNVMLGRIEALFSDLRASQARLRRFVGDASHELRTPIAAVSAYAQLFRQGAASRPEDLDRVMAGIERESSRMARLVEDLLTLARLDENGGLDMVPIELVDLVMEACETATLVGPAWPVHFVANDAVEIRGDRNALRQVIDNLLANVRAHTPEGTSTTVTVGASEQGAFVEVSDDGPGITEEQAQQIFERFYRSDPSRSRETGGAGLGLAIVASIVEAHGGKATARPGANRGAVFTVLLPLGSPPAGRP